MPRITEKTVKKFITADNREFDSREDATVHDYRIQLRAAIRQVRPMTQGCSTDDIVDALLTNGDSVLTVVSNYRRAMAGFKREKDKKKQTEIIVPRN